MLDWFGPNAELVTGSSAKADTLATKPYAPLRLLAKLARKEAAIVAARVHRLEPVMRWVIQRAMNILVVCESDSPKHSVQIRELPHREAVRPRPRAAIRRMIHERKGAHSVLARRSVGIVRAGFA